MNIFNHDNVQNDEEWRSFFSSVELYNKIFYLHFITEHSKPKQTDYNILELELPNVLQVLSLDEYSITQAEHMQFIKALVKDGTNGMLYLRGYWKETISLLQQGLYRAKEVDDKAYIYHLLSHVSFNLGLYTDVIEYCTASITLDKTSSKPNKKRISANYHQLGNVYYDLSQFEEARDNFERSIQIDQLIDNDLGIAYTLHALGVLETINSNHLQALELYKQSLEVKQKFQDTYGVAQTLGEIGNIHISLGNYDLAKQSLEESLQLTNQIGNRVGIAAIHYAISNLHYQLDNYAEAKKSVMAALELQSSLGINFDIAASLHLLGNIFIEIDQIEDAQVSFEKSLQIRRDINHKEGISTTLFQLGNVSLMLAKPKQAIRFLLESLTIDLELNNNKNIVNTLIQLGVTESDMGNLEPAVEYLLRALRVTTTQKGFLEKAYVLKQLSIITFIHEKYEASVSYGDQSLDIYGTFDNTEHDQIEIAYQVAISHANLGNMEEAKTYHDISLAFAKHSSDDFWSGINLFNLAQLAHHKGDIQVAYKLGKQALTLLRQANYTDVQSITDWVNGLGHEP